MMAAGQTGRAVLSILLFAGLAISKAHGGDAAFRNDRRLSPDGRAFAFEQYPAAAYICRRSDCGLSEKR
jgi:hypothetical protein